MWDPETATEKNPISLVYQPFAREESAVCTLQRDQDARHLPWWGGKRRAYSVTPDLIYDY